MEKSEKENRRMRDRQTEKKKRWMTKEIKEAAMREKER